ncbi:MAG: hypothetical protein AB8B66_02710 [Rickettsiaceae bacterium]
MELTIIFKALLALGVVFTIMYVGLKIIQRYTQFGTGIKANNKTIGLVIENIVYIDENTKIVSISNKNGFHYVISVGRNHSFLIDKYESSNKE